MITKQARRPHFTTGACAALCLSLALAQTACSDDSSGGGSAGTSGAASGGASGSGASGGSAGIGAAGGAGAGGVGDAGLDSGPPTCQSVVKVTVGSEIGPYVFQAVRKDPSALAGRYTFWADPGTPGNVDVARDGVDAGSYTFDPNMAVPERTSGEVATLSLTGLMDLDFRSGEDGLSDFTRLHESLFDNCHGLTIEAAGAVTVGGVYGGYEVLDITADGAAPAGAYTFFAATGNAGSVELRRDGQAVSTLDYPWQQMVGGGLDYTFDFPGVVAITVTRPSGNSNLFGMAQGLFDGRNTLTLPLAE